MFEMLRVSLAFLRKEFLLYRSYRFALMMNLGSILFGVATYFFLGKLFPEGLAGIGSHPSGYFGFVLLGISLSQFFISMLNGVSQVLSQERNQGTLEAILSCGASDLSSIVGMAVWNTLFSLSTGLIYLVIGLALLGPGSFSLVSLIRGLAVFAASGILFFGFGLLGAGFILISRRGNPIAWLISSLSVLFGGVYFPTDVLPGALKILAPYFPLTFALGSLRRAILSESSLRSTLFNIVLILIISACCYSISILFFRYVFARARRLGELTHQ